MAFSSELIRRHLKGSLVCLTWGQTWNATLLDTALCEGKIANSQLFVLENLVIALCVPLERGDGRIELEHTVGEEHLAVVDNVIDCFAKGACGSHDWGVDVFQANVSQKA